MSNKCIFHSLIYQTTEPTAVIVLEDLSTDGFATVCSPDDNLDTTKMIFYRLAVFHAASFFLVDNVSGIILDENLLVCICVTAHKLFNINNHYFLIVCLTLMLSHLYFFPIPIIHHNHKLSHNVIYINTLFLIYFSYSLCVYVCMCACGRKKN